MQIREELEKKFQSARGNMIMMTALSAINIVLALTSAGSFSFSAFMPLAAIGFGQGAAEETGDNVLLYAGIVIAVLIIAFYLVCWLVSKKTQGMMLAALIAFSLDTAVFLLFSGFFLLEGFDFGFLLDVVFHIWALACLISGVSAWAKLKKLPPVDESYVPGVVYDASGSLIPPPAEESMQYQPTAEGTLAYQPEAQETPALRPWSGKGRTLVSATYNTMEIATVRSTGLTELVINGQVYAERKGIMEPTFGYFLMANVEGVNIRTEYVPNSVYIYVNNQQVAKKLRLI